MPLELQSASQSPHLPWLINHWFDCLTYAAAAGAFCVVRLVDREVDTKPRATPTTVTYPGVKIRGDRGLFDLRAIRERE